MTRPPITDEVLKAWALRAVRTTGPGDSNCWGGMSQDELDRLACYMQEYRDAGVCFDPDYRNALFFNPVELRN